MIIAAIIDIKLEGLVVIHVEGIQLRQILAPDHAAGIDISGTEHVDALQKQPSAHHLLRWPMPVTGQDVQVRRSPKPEQSQWRFDPLVRRENRIGHIGIVVGPGGRVGQGSHAPQHRHIAPDFDLGAGQSCGRGRLHECCPLLCCQCQTCCPSIGPQHMEHACDKILRVVLRITGRMQILRNHQAGQIGRDGRAQDRTLQDGDTVAIVAGLIEATAQPLNIFAIAIHADHMQIRLANNLLQQLPCSCPQHQGVTLPDTGIVENLAGHGDPTAVILRFRGGSPVMNSGRGPFAETVKTALHGHHKEFVVGGEHGPGLAFDLHTPGNICPWGFVPALFRIGLCAGYFHGSDQSVPAAGIQTRAGLDKDLFQGRLHLALPQRLGLGLFLFLALTINDLPPGQGQRLGPDKAFVVGAVHGQVVQDGGGGPPQVLAIGDPT